MELAKGLVNGSPELDKVADEMADVYIMLHQRTYGLRINETVNTRIMYKMERLDTRLSK